MQNPIKKILLLLMVLLLNNVSAQDSLKVKTKSNPIIFYEAYIGFGGASTSGWILGGTINYQFLKRDLLTARVSSFLGYENNIALLAPTIGFPVFNEKEQITDYGILYGKRWISSGFSCSVSGGVSYNVWKHFEPAGDSHYKVEEHSFGFPFEVSLKFFKNQKRRFRVYYGLIPIGRQKVGFGRSIGFKFVGNISKTTYTGFAISYGFGWHKKY
ncbi:MAG: hypothetical protein V4535_04520 [Bacteroidota bacterium]